MATTSEALMNTERERFDKWCNNGVNHYADGDPYHADFVRGAWSAWQAQAAIIAERDAEIKRLKKLARNFLNQLQECQTSEDYAGFEVMAEYVHEFEEALGDNHD